MRIRAEPMGVSARADITRRPPCITQHEMGEVVRVLRGYQRSDERDEDDQADNDGCDGRDLVASEFFKEPGKWCVAHQALPFRRRGSSSA